MNRFASFLFAGALLLGAAPARTFTGVITDAMCGKNHAAMGVKPDAKCVQECVKSGSKYALYDGKTVYALSDQQTPSKFAAQKVVVKGALDEKSGTIKVDSIEAAK